MRIKVYYSMTVLANVEVEVDHDEVINERAAYQDASPSWGELARDIAERKLSSMESTDLTSGGVIESVDILSSEVLT